MGVWERYRLRLKRRRFLIRAIRKRRELHPVARRTTAIGASDVLLFATLRNERIRLPYFLKYYRDLGVGHFLIVDNGSDDGSAEYLAAQSDVSLWSTTASYRKARFGQDWLNWLLLRHGTGHWCLTVDADEFLIYPFCDSRPIRALTDWLDTQGIRSMAAMQLDMYPQGPIDAQPYHEGQDPFEIACWFDSGNYMISKNPEYGNLWIQGGPRARVYFSETPEQAPSLNKIPLVKWQRRFCYVSSTHILLPRGLNLVYDQSGGERISGCLLHAKFLSTMPAKVQEELTRREHFAGSREYAAYARMPGAAPDLWWEWSTRFAGWRQLARQGILSKGSWS